MIGTLGAPFEGVKMPLALKSDGLHFNSQALREFGSRYFDAYIDLVGTDK